MTPLPAVTDRPERARELAGLARQATQTATDLIGQGDWPEALRRLDYAVSELGAACRLARQADPTRPPATPDPMR